MKHTQKLELCLLNYFLLIAIAAMMIGVEFYFEMSKPNLKQEICAISTTATDIRITDINQATPALLDLRNKIVVMFGVLTLVVSIVMMMFVKNITRPLQKTLETARLINDGDLSQVIKIGAHDEVGQLGVVINDLTSNFQEIAVSTLSMVNVIEDKINSLSESLADENNTEQIALIKQELDALRGFINSFNLLQTELTE